MGQKVHPYGFRLRFNKSWRSRWFAKHDYARLLHEDLQLKSDLMLTMQECGFKFNTTDDTIDGDKAMDEIEKIVAKAVKDFNNNLPVTFPILPDSNVAKKYPGATQWDYINKQPVMGVKVYKAPKVDENASNKQPVKNNKRKDAEDMVNKPAADLGSKGSWMKVNPAATSPEPTNNNNEEDTTMNATIEKIENTTAPTTVAAAASAGDAAKAAILDLADKMGVDPTKAVRRVLTQPTNGTVGGAGKKKMTIVNFDGVKTSNSFWYRDIEGLDGINEDNASVSPVHKKADGSIFKYRVTFKEAVGGIEMMDFFKSNITGVLYNVNVKVAGVPLLKGFKIRFTKALDGALTVQAPSFKSGEKDGKPTYYSHIDLRDKDGKLTEVTFAAAILSAAECIMDLDGATVEDGSDDE
jgi:hypothetical protein